MDRLIEYSIAVATGCAAVWVAGRASALSRKPLRIALLNSIVGGSAAALGATALFKAAATAAAATSLADMARAAESFGSIMAWLALAGVLVGAASCCGSLLASARLLGWLGRADTVPGSRPVSIGLGAALLMLGAMINWQLDERLIVAFMVACGLFGVSLSLSLGRIGMPWLVALYGACAGCAMACAGAAMQSPALTIAGGLLAATGMLLTRRTVQASGQPIRQSPDGDPAGH